MSNSGSNASTPRQQKPIRRSTINDDIRTLFYGSTSGGGPIGADELYFEIQILTEKSISYKRESTYILDLTLTKGESRKYTAGLDTSEEEQDDDDDDDDDDDALGETPLKIPKGIHRWCEEYTRQILKSIEFSELTMLLPDGFKIKPGTVFHMEGARLSELRAWEKGEQGVWLEVSVSDPARLGSTRTRHHSLLCQVPEE